ncbi:Uma2 family endonuclease [Streptomyces olivaceus]|uniref:Uma2 family endonuclease n=1 Tax=Streptomyces olivaceus TaxID=47716 RepID=UPI0004C6EB04|nr:Uma2 family endonuclease [Streptomyces olivaceus]MBZ6107623.1 Uma2 family endonuclease [Streptomyces olivaceus]MBZ6287892.1 Uma2 family endonuclease [Streptomyces olivaceus]
MTAVGDYTLADLFTLPDLPCRADLIDGHLYFPRPQNRFHSITGDLLLNGLRRTLPPVFRVRRNMTVVLDRRNGLEPDVSLIHAEAITGWDDMGYRAEDVLLAAEVVAPDTEARDRGTKPHKYAAAGIPHFWLVEMDSRTQRPVVAVHRRDEDTGAYTLTGIHHDRLRISVPYDIDIDLTAIDNR